MSFFMFVVCIIVKWQMCYAKKQRCWLYTTIRYQDLTNLIDHIKKVKKNVFNRVQLQELFTKLKK